MISGIRDNPVFMRSRTKVTESLPHSFFVNFAWHSTARLYAQQVSACFLSHLTVVTCSKATFMSFMQDCLPSLNAFRRQGAFSMYFSLVSLPEVQYSMWSFFGPLKYRFNSWRCNLVEQFLVKFLKQTSAFLRDTHCLSNSASTAARPVTIFFCHLMDKIKIVKNKLFREHFNDNDSLRPDCEACCAIWSTFVKNVHYHSPDGPLENAAKCVAQRSISSPRHGSVCATACVTTMETKVNRSKQLSMHWLTECENKERQTTLHHLEDEGVQVTRNSMKKRDVWWGVRDERSSRHTLRLACIGSQSTAYEARSRSK